MFKKVNGVKHLGKEGVVVMFWRQCTLSTRYTGTTALAAHGNSSLSFWH
jgi:hypothetical protein